jgi:hypothetical protein
VKAVLGDALQILLGKVADFPQTTLNVCISAFYKLIQSEKVTIDWEPAYKRGEYTCLVCPNKPAVIVKRLEQHEATFTHQRAVRRFGKTRAGDTTSGAQTPVSEVSHHSAETFHPDASITLEELLGDIVHSSYQSLPADQWVSPDSGGVDWSSEMFDATILQQPTPHTQALARLAEQMQKYLDDNNRADSWSDSEDMGDRSSQENSEKSEDTSGFILLLDYAY